MYEILEEEYNTHDELAHWLNIKKEFGLDTIQVLDIIAIGTVGKTWKATVLFKKEKK